MINYLLLVAATIFSTGKALMCKALGAGGYTRKQTAVLNCKAFFVAFVCSLFFVINNLKGLIEISAFSLTLSVFFGLCVAFTQIMQAKAMGNGPASMVSLIYSCGFLVPILYGLVFWDESVSFLQWIGIALLIVVLCLIIEKKGEKTALLKWLPFAALAMLGSGANAIFQKTHQFSEFKGELHFFLVYALLFSALFSALAALVIREPKREAEKLKRKEQIKKNLLLPLCLGASVGLLNFMNLYLSSKLPSVVQFPVFNIGSMLLTSVISAIIYKDKPTKRQTVGFIIGIAAILMVGML